MGDVLVAEETELFAKLGCGCGKSEVFKGPRDVVIASATAHAENTCARSMCSWRLELVETLPIQVSARDDDGPCVGRPRSLAPETRARIAGLRRQGQSFAGIAATLNGEGVPTAHGGRQWWPAAVRAALAVKRPIPATLRWEVFRRDGFACQHCGAQDRLAADHVYPESEGGEAMLENLQTLCTSCNSRKGARL